MSFHVTYNFVQGYDAGQKKIVASEVDQNFSDIEGYINNSSVNISDPQTITGDKVFTGTVDLSGATVISSDNIPVGSIIWSANATVPAGYLLCNGASVGRDTYPELFAAIGTTYGEGDGSTTFNLPNLIGRFIEGASTAGTVKAAGLPNITGRASFDMPGIGSFKATASGSFYADTPRSDIALSQNNTYTTANSQAVLDASRSSSIYGNSTTVQPPSVTALPCIKAFSAVIGDATVVAGQLVNDIQSKVALDGSNVSSIESTLSTYMAHSAMPSGRKVAWSFPASGGIVTAPADGYICAYASGMQGTLDGALGLNVYASGNSGTICLSAISHWYGGSGTWIFVPVSAGQSVAVNYASTIDQSNATIYFTYANGSAPTV